MSNVLSDFSSEVGHLIIMSILKEGGRELQDIRAKLWELSDGNFHLENGRLSPFLYLMEQKGWIKSWWDTSTTLGGDRTKRFQLTSEGRSRLREMLSTWNQLASIMQKFDNQPSSVISD